TDQQDQPGSTSLEEFSKGGLSGESDTRKTRFVGLKGNPMIHVPVDPAGAGGGNVRWQSIDHVAVRVGMGNAGARKYALGACAVGDTRCPRDGGRPAPAQRLACRYAARAYT